MEQGKKRNSKTIKIGGFDHVKAVLLGGDYPVVIQTMWKDRLSFQDLEGKAAEALVSRIDNLSRMGCGLLRFAVPASEDAEIIGNLAGMVSMPIVADIHFDYKIALRCMDFPIAKLRINPGNIGGKEKLRAVLEKAASKSIPIRIGVNGGSLPAGLRSAPHTPLPNPHSAPAGSYSQAEALVLAAEREIALFNEFGFSGFMVSMKASSVADTIKANRIFSARSDAPLHIGVTEAGPLIAGVVRNTAAILELLKDGIGDTIRVSLSDTVEREVITAREILGVIEGRNAGVRIVSCPRCGRSGFDTHGFTDRWQERLYVLDKDITVAVMGCAVNGPTEARHADLGITGAGDKVLIFRRGEIVRTINAAEADAVFEEELEKIFNEEHG